MQLAFAFEAVRGAAASGVDLRFADMLLPLFECRLHIYRDDELLGVLTE